MTISPRAKTRPESTSATRLFDAKPPPEPPLPSGVVAVGIDVSLTATGIAVLKDDGTHHIDTIHTAPGDFDSRFARIDHIVDAIQFNLPPPGAGVIVCLEKPFIHTAHISNSEALIAVGYMVRRHLTRNGYDYIDVTPAHLKQFVSGTGSAKKSAMQMDVLWRWSVRTADDHQADAYGLARIAARAWQWKLARLNGGSGSVDAIIGELATEAVDAWPSWLRSIMAKIIESKQEATAKPKMARA